METICHGCCNCLIPCGRTRMHDSLLPYEERVKKGLIRRVDKGDLVLYNYTDQCTYEKAWDEYTRAARGIVFNKYTGEVIARPFPKFFNLGEHPEVVMHNLPKDEYKVYEKMDGSLGIIYFHDGEWQVNTRGSFTSEQAIKAKEMLKKYNLDSVLICHTLLVEIIYPSNKIIINYGDAEELVLLGAINKETGEDIPVETLLSIYPRLGMRAAPEYNYRIEEMIELQKTLPKNQEGFVVRFNNGVRVKIKGHEYLAIAKILSEISPLSFWEAMEDGKVSDKILMQIPEEYRNEWEPIRDKIETAYRNVKLGILEDISKLPTTQLTPEGRKAIGLFVKNNKDKLNHPGAIFPYLMGKENDYIMKTIRPTGNVIKAS